MKNRSFTFQHYVFHPANFLIHIRSFSGIIDFQRMDWGDPLHDLTKIGFFAIQTSIPFSKGARSEEHTSELQSRGHLVCRLLLEKKKQNIKNKHIGVFRTTDDTCELL